MPIKSYLAYPVEGRRDELSGQLSRMNGCEVHSATNAELLILVTDTHTSQEEESLWQELQSVPSLERLDLVSGHLESDEDFESSMLRSGIEAAKEAGG